MVAHRRKDLVVSRRRIEDEGEEEGSVAAELDDDSLSEGSGLSDDEEDDYGDADGSDVSGESPRSPRISDKPSVGANGRSKPLNGVGELKANHSTTASGEPLYKAMTDTQAMMNGLNISEQSDNVEEIHFDEMTKDTSASTKVGPQPTGMGSKNETPFEKRKREHDEYRKQRDTDPAFVPNRGGFFMHDHRHAGPGQNGFKPFGRGRGRGRGTFGGPFSPANQTAQANEPTDAPWTHDLHEIVVQSATRASQSATVTTNIASDANTLAASSSVLKALPSAPRFAATTRSFSKSVQIGNIQIRVYLAGMPHPITFSAVPVKQHTRLPHHRPPLRRDKPVRISLPEQPPRYIFPAVDRSFIFIPRALRPNQQGFGRGRGNIGPHGGLSSRRTSAYGGSAYSPSIAMSRRSSLARELTRENIISPTGSTMSRPPLANPEIKPIVRLPPAAQQVTETTGLRQAVGEAPTSIADVQDQTYPPPQKPTYRENRPVPLPMHQPRPQKAVSVADIESPATLSFHPPQQQQQQPFHQQVPPQVNGHTYPQDPAACHPHSRHASYPSQASAGTPLSQIPERAIHAQPFQPYPYQQPQAFYPHAYPIPGPYFYPPPDSRSLSFVPPLAPSAVTAPVFVPGAHQAQYVLPAVSASPAETAPSGITTTTVAHETNGMVYYYDSTQLAAGASADAVPGAQYPPPNFAMLQPGTVGIGGMITPSPEFYAQAAQAGVYYP
ncbi:MAG: hypothetical protein M1835_001842 [Candelina submexicana]|nr:MAG: hypothetical protein M1835_001842 [Candelina submexicana]